MRLLQNSSQLFLRAQPLNLVIRFSVSTLRDSFGFAAEPRPDLTKNPFKPSRLAQTFHASDMSVQSALCRQSSDGLVWFGLEDGLDQQLRYLIYTKHNNTEHRLRLYFLVSTHAQVAHYRGRKLGCPSPPAQIRACALTHPAPTSGVDDKPLASPQVTDGGFRPMEACKAVQCWPTVAIFLQASAQNAQHIRSIVCTKFARVRDVPGTA